MTDTHEVMTKLAEVLDLDAVILSRRTELNALNAQVDG